MDGSDHGSCYVTSKCQNLQTNCMCVCVCACVLEREKNNIYYKVFDNTYNNVKQENNYKTKETKKEISKLKPIDNEDIINKTINSY